MNNWGLAHADLPPPIGPQTHPPTFAESPPGTGACVLTHPRNRPAHSNIASGLVGNPLTRKELGIEDCGVFGLGIGDSGLRGLRIEN